MNLTIDRKAYAEELGEPEELLEPIPQCALARFLTRMTDFQLMLPTATPKVYAANFQISEDMAVDGVLIRFGYFPPFHLPWTHGRTLFTRKTDNVCVWLRML